MALPGPDSIFLLSPALLGHPPAALLLHMDVAACHLCISRHKELVLGLMGFFPQAK